MIFNSVIIAHLLLQERVNCFPVYGALDSFLMRRFIQLYNSSLCGSFTLLLTLFLITLVIGKFK